MHYKNGRTAHEGDPVVFPPEYIGRPFRAGTLHTINTMSDTCNAIITTPTIGGTQNSSVNIKDGYHAEDAWNALLTLVCLLAPTAAGNPNRADRGGLPHCFQPPADAPKAVL